MPRFIIACWMIFLAVWLIAAARAKPSVERQSAISRASYLVLIIAAGALLTHAVARPLGARLIPHSSVTSFVADLLCAGGLLVTLWARTVLGTNWSPDVAFKKQHELIVRGPYRVVRHPIYSGILLMFLASAFAAGRIGGLLAFALCFASFWIKLRQEEALMTQHFPAAYPDYKARTKALVPYLL